VYAPLSFTGLNSIESEDPDWRGSTRIRQREKFEITVSVDEPELA
jgi:hypothetical protein